MSSFQDSHEKWRTLGSLRYLADELGVSVKQVTRYWDNDWIEGRYRTPKGQRRIRYTDNVVERVAQIVMAAKETNIHIRYHLPEIEYCGIVVPVKGCTSMHGLHRRARKAGLNKRDASALAYTPSINPVQSAEELKWDMLHALKGITEEEVAISRRDLAVLPLGMLLAAKDAKDFRAKARKAWKGIVSYFKAKEGWDALSFSGPEGRIRRKKTKAILRNLLSQPDLASFLSEWHRATELEHRLMETEPMAYHNVNSLTEQNPNAARLNTAALRIKHLQCAPTAKNLAHILNMSRPALYRTFGTEAVWKALKLVRNDALAIREGAEEEVHNRKRRTRPSGAQEGGTLPHD